MALKRSEILLEKATSEFPASQVRDRATCKDSRTSIQAREVCENSESARLEVRISAALLISQSVPGPELSLPTGCREKWILPLGIDISIQPV